MTDPNPRLKPYFVSLIKMDRETNDCISAELDATGWDGFPRLLAALFFVAVERRFGDEPTTEEIIRFVAELRVGMSGGGPGFAAEDAELLIRANVDPTLEFDVDPEMIGRVQAAAVYKILGDEELSDGQLEAVIDDAIGLAARN